MHEGNRVTEGRNVSQGLQVHGCRTGKPPSAGACGPPVASARFRGLALCAGDRWAGPATSGPSMQLQAQGSGFAGDHIAGIGAPEFVGELSGYIRPAQSLGDQCAQAVNWVLSPWRCGRFARFHEGGAWRAAPGVDPGLGE